MTGRTVVVEHAQMQLPVSAAIDDKERLFFLNRKRYFPVVSIQHAL